MGDAGKKQGPLAGIKVVELSGIGLAPMGAMLLADLGTEVITIERLAPNSGALPTIPLNLSELPRNPR